MRVVDWTECLIVTVFASLLVHELPRAHLPLQGPVLHDLILLWYRIVDQV